MAKKQNVQAVLLQETLLTKDQGNSIARSSKDWHFFHYPSLATQNNPHGRRPTGGPITTKEKLYYAKSTAMAKAAAGSWSRLPALAELSKFQSSINAIDNTDGHLKPLFRGHTADAVFMIGFRQSQYILTKPQLHLEHVPTTRPVQLAANLDEAPRMAGKGSPPLDP